MRAKYENFNNAFNMKRNLREIGKMRLIMTILIGVATGILGFDGPVGILFWLACNLFVSCLLAVRFGFAA